MSSRRYEIVGEPEALEVVDDEAPIYPDHSGGGLSIHSLQQFTNEPIKLRTIFMDPRWTPGQRKMCFCTLATVTCLLVAVLLALFIGLIKVLNAIDFVTAEQNHGLQIEPHWLRDENDKVLRYEVGVDNIINIENNGTINTFLEKMEAESKELDCANIPDCFDIDTVINNNMNCTKENGFGWLEGNDPPCILLIFVKPKKWNATEMLKGGQDIEVTCRIEGINSKPPKPVKSEHFSHGGKFSYKTLASSTSDQIPPMLWMRPPNDDMKIWEYGATLTCELAPPQLFNYENGKNFVGMVTQRFRLYVKL